VAGICGTRICRLGIGDSEKWHFTLNLGVSAVRDRTDRVRDLGCIGLCGKSARPESFLQQQLSIRSRRWQYTDPRRASVERIELAGVTGLAARCIRDTERT